MAKDRVAKTYKVDPEVHAEIVAAARTLRDTHVYPMSGDGQAATTQADIVENEMRAGLRRLRKLYNGGRRFR